MVRAKRLLKNKVRSVIHEKEDNVIRSKKDRDIFSVQKQSKKKAEKVLENTAPASDGEDEVLQEIKQLASRTKEHKKKFHNFVQQGLKVSYKDLSMGSLVGCCVTKVFTDRICVTLPYRMKGHIPLTHISAQYTKLMHQLADGKPTSEAAHTLPELYWPGQYLTATVAAPTQTSEDDVHPGKKQKTMGVALSLYPNDVHGSSVNASALRSGCVLQCSVTSCEDHGYTMDTGVRGVAAAFLPEKDVPRDKLVAVGSVLPCCIVSVTGDVNALSLTLSADPKTVVAAANKTFDDDKYNLLLPGTSVVCVVSESNVDGLAVHLGSEEQYYSSLYPEDSELPQTKLAASKIGMISAMHLRGPYDQCHLFRVGQKLVAKVLLVTGMPRTVHLTLNKTVCNNYLPAGEDPMHGLVLDTVVPDASVIDTCDLGVNLRLSAKCRAFCPLNKLPKALKSRKLAQKYQSGTKVECKLLFFNPFDQIFFVSLKPADIKDQQSIPDELKVGKVVRVKILRHLDVGAVVQYTSTGRGRGTKSVQGFVPRLHLTDKNVSDPSSRHPVGKIVEARVLAIEINESRKLKHKLIFTLKTLIVKSDLQPICEYSDNCIGQEAEGVVTKVHPDKIFVQFFGETMGLLYANDYADVPNMSEMFQVGNVTRVKIKGIGKFDPPVYFLSHLTKSFKTRKRKIVLTEFDVAAEKKKIMKKNLQDSWLQSLKKTVGECPQE
ncbi:protein RRP5 homolog [Hyalella azteca]|uniref:Protein RRP5 homolog n=1 Tax=Hyalella azteca TaxID=294128 RepID=A0A8B7NRN3_HYAAZ|nr:protein RRP5 homolog [Hyalella azteca]